MNDYSSEDHERMSNPEEVNQGDVHEIHPDDIDAEETRLEEKTHMQEHDTHSNRRASEDFAWLKDDECDELQSRWDAIQIEFVDDPRASVEKADALIADTFERIQREFSNRRKTLNEQWGSRENVSTEDLRVTLQSYRAFINRLLAL